MSAGLVPLIAILLQTAVLSMGSAPDPVEFPHFPDRVHAFVWRNWPLVHAERMAEVLNTDPETVLEIGRGMGLDDPPEISDDQWRRSYITIIRRNWHLLPYQQLLQLLDWTEEEMAFTLREDDFLFIKLGSLKPRCEPLAYREPNDATLTRRAWIRSVLQKSFPNGVGRTETPLFGFVSDLSRPLESPAAQPEGPRKPRWCYSYFALYGDPLLNPELDPFPEGYLDRLAASGVNGVWLQAVLFNLAPYPWNPKLSEGYETRLENLKRLVARAGERGIGVYLYLNEPRSMPLAFFEGREELRGVVEGDYAAVCTSVESVRNHLVESVESICRAVPDLAGFFTITASENLTNCWSHHQGMACPKCATREPAEVIAEVNSLIQKGIDQSGASTRLIAWDWGWKDEWAEGILNRLPKKVGHMSVSEWSQTPDSEIITELAEPVRPAPPASAPPAVQGGQVRAEARVEVPAGSALVPTPARDLRLAASVQGLRLEQAAMPPLATPAAAPVIQPWAPPAGPALAPASTPPSAQLALRPAPSARVADPLAACAEAGFLTRPMCIQRECRKAALVSHPICVGERNRLEEQERRQQYAQ